MIRVVILTGSEPRHSFLRLAIGLSPKIEVLRSYCEGLEQNLSTMIDPAADNSNHQIAHVAARKQSEEDFFEAFNHLASDHSRTVLIPKGAINDRRHVHDIESLRPDILVAYGCSLIKSPLITKFSGRFLNLHLGLSPYYRGSGTNFWPLVNREPEYVGATFMYLNEGVDTGEIIHQLRARVFLGDTPHQIGNRLIADAVGVYRRLIEEFENIQHVTAPPSPGGTHFYRRRDFSPSATMELYDNFSKGMIEAYLEDYDRRVALVPIAVNPMLNKAGTP